MSTIDADVVRDALSDESRTRLASLECFAAIESTNTYLMQRDGPEPGMLSVAMTANQTAGRGRHGKSWQSPPGSGLALSIAYTFASKPGDLPALTLVIGLAAIDALEDLGIGGVQLKWPNDLIASGGKLGGILTEAQTRDAGRVTIVTGIGINLALGADFELARQTTDLEALIRPRPRTERVAASLIDRFHAAFTRFESTGFAGFAADWANRDWLLGRDVVIETAQRRVAGVGAGIAEDGALLLETDGSIERVTSGTVIAAAEGGQ
ncbi:MAG: biotin--[acetyl-CoA-carboxylase] ligase [Woeseiaceae bacterium]|nr:biotin--[acetyl-CoA-carboxylase] ligase [Woeseiaceae bacterium]